MTGAALERVRAAVDAAGWLDAPHDMAPYLAERRGLYQGRAAAVVCPRSTREVADVVAACQGSDLAIVPQGGNTGLSGGAVATDAERQIVLSLRRMNRVRAVDPAAFTLTCEAGCVLADIQHAAREAGRYFPLSLSAEGSCQIGGNLATNAGGTNVLRYGNARAQTLGVEAVLADGSVWNGLKELRKDNSGYDLRDLLIGSEGTLGIITAAVLRLYPPPVTRATALVALSDIAEAIELFGELRAASGDSLTGCELMNRTALALTTYHIPGCRDPFAEHHPWYLLLELSASRGDADLRGALEAVLERRLERGGLRDAVLAENESQRAALWHLRDSISEAQRHAGASIKHDVSVPIGRVPELIARGRNALAEHAPGTRICAFGHLGDGNIHYNLSQPEDAEPHSFLARWDELNEIVLDIVVELGGSVSAEHGIGLLKRAALARYGSPVALSAMRRIKQALDPDGRLNPGKIL